MLDKRKIEGEIERLESLGGLARGYSQIASGRMLRTRKSVLSSREFLEALKKVFDEVRVSYQRQVLELAKKKGWKRGARITLLSHNGKKVAVLLSSNTGLYGDIVGRTFEKFLEDIRSGEAEAAVIGKKGLAMYLGREPERPYTFFDLPDREVGSDDMVEIIRHLVAYEEIHVYYGKFESVVIQTPTVFNVSAGVDVDETVEDKKGLVKYLFEPSLEKILMFFETEIFASLFEQAVRESQLARSASRIVSMDKAEEKIREELGKMELSKLRLSHRVNNKKQQELMVSTVGVFR